MCMSLCMFFGMAMDKRHNININFNIKLNLFIATGLNSEKEFRKIVPLVKLLHSPTTTQSHWSSGSTTCFPPRGAAVRVPGMHPHF